MKTTWLATAMALAALVAFAAGCKPAEKTPAPAPAPDLTRIQTDVANKTITIEGRFCLTQGILDYFAVVSGGHEYESIVALNCKASLLHANLLALGAAPGLTDEIVARLKQNPPEGDKLPEKGGTKFSVTVEWEQDGKTVSMPATKLLINRKTKQSADDAAWSFTGSYFAKHPETGKDVYMGDMDQDLLAVFWAPSAVMNFEKDNGNPYDMVDTGYEVNTAVVPKFGTPCKVILKMLADK